MKILFLLLAASIVSNENNPFVVCEKVLSIDMTLAMEYHRAECRWFEISTGNDADGNKIKSTDEEIVFEKKIQDRIFKAASHKDVDQINEVKQIIMKDAQLHKIISQARAKIEKANRSVISDNPPKAKAFRDSIKKLYEVIDDCKKKRHEIWGF